MSRLFLSILMGLSVFVFASTSQAQIAVSNISFNEGMQKIAKEHKLMMVIMDLGQGNASINNSTSKALLDSDASDLNKIAIVIRPSVGSPDWDSLNKKYFTPMTFGTLFFNPNGVLVHRYDAINEHGHAYLVQADNANNYIDLSTEEEQLDYLRRVHFSDLKAVKNLFTTRTNSVESTDDLLESFVENTPRDSFENYRYYFLLAKFAPILRTQADSIFRGVQKFDSNWYQIPASERVEINRKIIKKTMNAAVNRSDLSLATYLALFSSSILANTTQFNVKKEQIRIMSDYFYKIHDTLNYLGTASILLNDYYMTLSIDSLKKVYADREKERFEKEGKKTLYINGVSIDSVSYYGELDLIARILNHHAWEFYVETRDSVYLKMALTWAKRSLEFNKSPFAMDTYAQLLYINGDRNGAISAEKDALAEYKKRNLNSNIPKIEKVLENMENNREVIDVE
jgi:hypothetical protein